ncbi:MAG: glycosyltransferase family 2 protein [Pseudomonadota bacterium]
MSGIRILMCSYNGSDYLRAQITSFQDQTFGKWSLWVSDDGSSDRSLDVIRDAHGSAPRELRVLNGPRQGFAANFLSGLCSAELSPGWVALADQDDVWFPDKLERAMDRLGGLDPDVPALACGRTMLTDRDLRPMGPSRLHHDFSFRNALVQNVVAGNTIVLNPAAHRLVRAAGVPDIPYHDWWIYLLVTAAGGTVVYDPKPCMYYRQHGHNVLGENRSLGGVMRRATSFGSRTWRGWFEANMAALHQNRDLLSEDAKATLDAHTAALRTPAFARLRALHAIAPRRQYRHETLALYIGTALGLA